MKLNKSRRKRRLLTWETEESINLTPLLDVIFNLIFFFLLATTLRQSREFLEVRLPRANEAVKAQPPKKTMIITLTSEDEIYLSDKELTLEQLEEELMNTPPEEIDGIILQGDAMAHHEAVVRILDACSKTGHSGVAVEVRTEKRF